MLNMDDRDLRRAWTIHKKSRVSFDKILWLLGQLDYEVHFVVVRKGTICDAQDQRLSISEDQGVSTRQPENSQATTVS